MKGTVKVMTLVEKLTLMFMQQLTKNPAGRVHFLTQLSDAENNDEGRVFEALKERAKVFAQNSNRNLFHALDHGLLKVNPFVRFAWRAAGNLSTLINPSRPTRFTHQAQLEPALATA